LSISSIAITGTYAGDYSQTNNCPVSPAVLAVSASCTITVTFAPTTAGLLSAALTITDNGSGSPQSLPLNGTGVPPVVTLSPTSITGSLAVGAKASGTVTLTNSGPGTLSISSIAITGADAGDYSQTNNCPVSPAVLAASASCGITVTFAPTAGGLLPAAITITDNGSASPQSVTLNGTGLLSAVGLSTGSLTFAAQTVSTTSAAQTVTVTNKGPGTLSISSITITGANSGDFGQTNNCPASLALNASCTVNVTFTPTATGSRTASLTITDNGSASPQSVSLTGTGQ
jgi:hypothetical protein